MSRETAFSITKPRQHLREGRSQGELNGCESMEGEEARAQHSALCTGASHAVPITQGKTGCTPSTVPALPPAGDTLWPAQIFVSFLVLQISERATDNAVPALWLDDFSPSFLSTASETPSTSAPATDAKEFCGTSRCWKLLFTCAFCCSSF